ncbi:MAG: class I SAM-dependent methyltransferase [Ignavibacteria bacterium]
MSSKQYFDNVASQWDKMRQSFYSEAVRKKALEIANVESGKIAADIGAGTGFITEGLVAAGLRVIAVDQSEAMLLEMKKKFTGIKGIDYRAGGSGNLPIQNESIDYAFANMYLHHVESPPREIEEMTRILKPGGKLVITDLDEHSYEFLRTEQHDRWLGFKRRDIERWLNDAGLKNVLVNCAGEDCCTKSNCGTESASISIFIALGTK